MRKRFAIPATLLVTAFLALPGQAQRGSLSGPGGFRGRGTAMQGRPHGSSRGVRQGGSLTGPPNRRYSRRSRSYAAPYLYPPYYYSDYYSEPAPTTEAQPSRVVVIERSEPRAAAPPPPPPPDALVLERQGNHWVRVTSSGRQEAGTQSGQKGGAQASTQRAPTPQQSVAIEPPREVPPATLVFRDGHKEEITRYTIVGGTIYTNADYWNNGSWTKKVPLAELNIPATLELNRERGANFSLPSGPGIIAIRP